MTRTEKIQKLGNAIKDYLGAYNEHSGQWIRPPQHKSINRVKAWLERLRLPVEESLKIIRGFHHIREYHDWIKLL